MKFSLHDKTALVTGGGSGIGRAICLALASQGAKVAVVDLDLAPAMEVQQQILAAGGTASAHACDVRRQAEVKATVARITKAFDNIDILINNAGVAHVGSLEQTTEADLDRLYAVNVKGVYNCAFTCLEHLKVRGGVILNLASIASSVGLENRFAYSMSKGAVLTMTYSIARDYLKHNIRCNCISPARVHTPFVDNFIAKNFPGREAEAFARLSKTQPIGRMAQPEEIANLAVYLCSDEAAFITGSNIPIDGGFLTLNG
ncbi:MAG: SDR family oxidoreductase [Bacteroidota bacterium]